MYPLERLGWFAIFINKEGECINQLKNAMVELLNLIGKKLKKQLKKQDWKLVNLTPLKQLN